MKLKILFFTLLMLVPKVFFAMEVPLQLQENSIKNSAGHEQFNALIQAATSLTSHSSNLNNKRNRQDDETQEEENNLKKIPCTWSGCDKSFSRQSNLNIHIKAVHKKIKDTL